MPVKQEESVSPILRPGSRPEDLRLPGLFCGVSVIPCNPILSTKGSDTFISFLASLPHPSVVVIADSLEFHNVKAMCRGGKKPPRDEKAMAMALQAAAPFRKFLENAIRKMEDERPDRLGWVTLLGWEDMKDEGLKERQAIARRHYDEATSLRPRIDAIAEQFLAYRRPQSKNLSGRLPHMVSYLLEELPWFITGFELNGCEYRTFLYPTTVSKLEEGNVSLANAMWDLTHDIHTKEEFAELRQELVASASGREVIPGVVLLPLPPLESTKNKDVVHKVTNAEKEGDTPIVMEERVRKVGNVENVVSKQELPPEPSSLQQRVRKLSIEVFKRNVSCGGMVNNGLAGPQLLS